MAVLGTKRSYKCLVRISPPDPPCWYMVWLIWINLKCTEKVGSIQFSYTTKVTQSKMKTRKSSYASCPLYKNTLSDMLHFMTKSSFHSKWLIVLVSSTVYFSGCASTPQFVPTTPSIETETPLVMEEPQPKLEDNPDFNWKKPDFSFLQGKSDEELAELI